MIKKKQQALARNLIKLDTRLNNLESMLLLNPQQQHEAPDDENLASMLYDLDFHTTTAANTHTTSSNDTTTTTTTATTATSTSLTSTPRLQMLVAAFLYLQHLLSNLPPDHPFVVAQDARVKRAKATIVGDLSAALKECRADLKIDGLTDDERRGREGRLLEVLKLWSDMGDAKDAVKTLKR